MKTKMYIQYSQGCVQWSTRALEYHIFYYVNKDTFIPKLLKPAAPIFDYNTLNTICSIINHSFTAFFVYIFGQNQNFPATKIFLSIFFFIFIFIYIMLILKEFCISKGSHSKNLVNQPTLLSMVFNIFL